MEKASTFEYDQKKADKVQNRTLRTPTQPKRSLTRRGA